jgi:flagellar protein FlaG
MINEVVNTGFQLRAVPVETPATPVAAAVSPTPAESLPSSTEAGKAQAESTTTDSSQLQKAVSKLNDYVQNLQRKLSFSVSAETGRTIIKVYDAETDELIRQIPPDETIRLAESIDVTSANLFVKERV